MKELYRDVEVEVIKFEVVDAADAISESIQGLRETDEGWITPP